MRKSELNSAFDISYGHGHERQLTCQQRWNTCPAGLTGLSYSHAIYGPRTTYILMMLSDWPVRDSSRSQAWHRLSLLDDAPPFFTVRVNDHLQAVYVNCQLFKIEGLFSSLYNKSTVETPIHLYSRHKLFRS